MATTQYKDNADHIYEFQQEAGDAGGAEKRPVAGMPAAVRVQLADMAAALAELKSTVIGGVVKGVLQAGTAVIGKLGPNVGVNIGTVDVASGTFTMGGSIPAGANHIGSVAVDAAIPAGNNNIGDVDVASLPAIGQLPASVGAKASAGSLSVVLANDHGAQAVSLVQALPTGTNNIGDVDVLTLPPLGQLPASLGQKNMAQSTSVAIATDQVVTVTASGGTLGVMGTVTAQQGPPNTFPNAWPTILTDGVRGASIKAGLTPPTTADQALVVTISPNSPMAVNDGGGSLTVDGNVTVSGAVLLNGSIPAGTNNIGDVDVLTLPAIGQLPASVGQKAAAASMSVVLASDQPVQNVAFSGALPAGNNIIGSVNLTAPNGVNVSTVAAIASSVTLAAVNAIRTGCIIVNDADATLFVKFGAGASLSNWSFAIQPDGYWEMPYRYFTGVISGIWEDTSLREGEPRAVTGNARVTEV